MGTYPCRPGYSPALHGEVGGVVSVVIRSCPAPRPHLALRPGALLLRTGSLADGARRRVTASPFRSQRRRLRPGLRPARLRCDIVTRVCRGGNRRAPVLRGSGRRLRARPDPGGPALSAVTCAVEPPMGERPGTQAAARYRLTSPWRISSAYYSAAGP